MGWFSEQVTLKIAEEMKDIILENKKLIKEQTHTA